MPLSPIALQGRTLRPHKALVGPRLRASNVLTDEPWTFVALWLKREKQDEAGFYWEQARNFFEASRGLPLQSAPLLLYYSLMNATKALLRAKGMRIDPYHGVKSWAPGDQTRDPLKAMGIEILKAGVLPSLSQYFGEREQARKHSLQAALFNLPFIHRTYCLTYERQTDMFIPLKDCVFLWDSVAREARFSACLSKDHVSQHIIKRLPRALVKDVEGDHGAIRSLNSVPCARPKRPTPEDIVQLEALHRAVREELFYINGAQTLWYVKAVTAGSATLSLAVMHRLSELCRYSPMDMVKLLDGDRNWLIREFIAMAPGQVIDELSAELTGHQILAPNIRPAS
jgi:hypothetical protein